MNLLLLPLAVLLAKLTGKSEPPTTKDDDMQHERDVHRSVHGGIDMRATVLLLGYIAILGGILQCGPGHLPLLGVRVTLTIAAAGVLSSCVSIVARLRGLGADGRTQHRLLAAITRRKIVSFNLSLLLIAADVIALVVTMWDFH